MAGTATPRPYVKTGCDKPSSTPAEIAASKSPTKAADEILVANSAVGGFNFERFCLLP